jgi:predicted RNA binding protein YcfA (HicA-like mRNA interferase family)
MTRLSVVSGRDLVKVFARFGYLKDHQRGSHIILRQESPPYRRLTIPDHQEIAKGTLRTILREAGITLAELLEML